MLMPMFPSLYARHLLVCAISVATAVLLLGGVLRERRRRQPPHRLRDQHSEPARLQLHPPDAPSAVLRGGLQGGGWTHRACAECDDLGGLRTRDLAAVDAAAACGGAGGRAARRLGGGEVFSAFVPRVLYCL